MALCGAFLLDKRRFPYYIIDIVVRLYWAERYVPGPSTGEEVPRLFLWRIALRELSVFIDESGDFGDYCFHSPYYIIAMIFHNQSTDIQYKCFFIEKKHIADSVEAAGKLSKQISNFIRAHYDEFLSFDDVKIYYDKRKNGCKICRLK